MRRRKAKKIATLPDPKFNDVMVTKFVNNIMLQGKKGTAFTIFYDAIEKVATKTQEDGIEVWRRAVENVTPAVEVRSRRVGGATFQIPTEIRPKRKVSIGMKWLIRFARTRSGKGMAEKLAAEIIAASKNEGNAVKKKEDTHRMAEANRAFAHFRT
jgi:small subunit ribosomal protein S7